VLRSYIPTVDMIKQSEFRSLPSHKTGQNNLIFISKSVVSRKETAIEMPAGETCYTCGT